eukprot:CAMPEP_0113936210 /NCGR_PEP_ID=MMETSP1339-20121228/3174_1 /TAXON_ID=94617 /ORGANISM="Fibrocapsa japonica" /LENGTH=185 /DNA_ID=CAMNT_0000938597 /DNA_START=148 /DNA_END=705 /DNA_ORIENTATION=+ /assembly_acc=CAM_ASM_000762
MKLLALQRYFSNNSNPEAKKHILKVGQPGAAGSSGLQRTPYRDHTRCWGQTSLFTASGEQAPKQTLLLLRLLHNICSIKEGTLDITTAASPAGQLFLCLGEERSSHITRVNCLDHGRQVQPLPDPGGLRIDGLLRRVHAQAVVHPVDHLLGGRVPGDDMGVVHLVQEPAVHHALTSWVSRLADGR